MYESHFGFSGPPFQLNPDPAFYFNSRGHGHALAYLRYGAAQGEGFIVVTGEIGAGKTTLVRTLLDELDRAKIVPAQIVSTQLAEGELLQAILSAYGIPSQGTSKASLLATLEAFLMALATQGRRALLIVDEAQNLQTKVIEELRMLSNFQLGTHALMQSFLVGQPELRKKLESPDLEQLRQRVTASCHLGPLDIPETQAYIAHRLTRVGWDGQRPYFSDAAYREVHRWSGGVPRRINRLCNRILLAAFLENSDEVTVSLAERTALELRQEIGESFAPMPPEQVTAAVVAVAVDVDTGAPATAQASSPVSAATSNPAAPMGGAPVSAVAPIDDSAAVAKPALTPAPTTAQEPCVESVASTTPPAAVSPVMPMPDSGAACVDVPLELPFTDRSALFPEVVRTQNIALKRGNGVVLCVVDSVSAALKIAAIAKRIAAVDGAPRMILVNPGSAMNVWPWGEMESTLPMLEVGLHFGVVGHDYPVSTAMVLDGFARVLEEFQPLGVLVAGDGDDVLTCALMAHKCGVPVLRLEAGDRLGGREARLNAVLIEQFADILFASNETRPHQALQHAGISPDRVVGVPGRLADDVRAAVGSAMTTPDGALMRHSLPMFLGPRWSAEVDGTAYVVVALEAVTPERVQVLVDVLLEVDAVPKLIWLISDATAHAVKAWRAQHPDMAGKIFETDDVKLDRNDIDRRNTASILCSRVTNVADQFSILRGSVGLISEPGQVLMDVAKGFNVPCLLLRDRRLSAVNGIDNSDDEHAWGAVIVNEKLSEAGVRASKARLTDLGPISPVADDSGAATCLAAWLLAWATTSRSTRLSVSAKDLEPRAPETGDANVMAIPVSGAVFPAID